MPASLVKNCARFGLLIAASLAAACGGSGPYQLVLMPAPDIYAEAVVDPFEDLSPMEIADGDAGVLYVTDRAPYPGAGSYSSDRGHVLRAGVATVKLGEGTYTWDEARRISLLKNRTEDYPIKVENLQEFGILPESLTRLEQSGGEIGDPAATDQLVARIQAHLDRSSLKEINIYVHGYKVVFENPILVVAELWHYLGYEGSFVAFSWPATPKRLAYIADVATAQYSGARLRRLVQLLSERTTAERINLIGYSAGSRVVVTALEQLSLMQYYADPDALRERGPRLGNIVLIGADVERALFGRVVAEGALNVAENITVYVSAKDKALGFSKWLYGGEKRLGESFSTAAIGPEARAWLAANPGLSVIDVTDAANAQAGNGHGYFRSSPWVSGDLLMLLRHGLAPADRGLVMHAEEPIWLFPEDYFDRLRVALAAAGAASKPSGAPVAEPDGSRTDL
jgi:esterase/lipase superfamily enzyme